MVQITVLGSINVDTILQIPRLPLPGETISMGDKSNAGGGKGANQVIAAARAGATTYFIGKVGQDANGEFMLAALQKDQVSTANITVDAQVGTGQAFILLDEKGQNSILVYGGTNQVITPQDVQASEATIAASDFLIAQFEVPIPAVTAAFKLAKQHGVTTILNPAPAIADIPNELLALTDLIVPNETECQTITGIEVTDETSMKASAEKMQALGVPNLIITVGAKGAFYATPNASGFVPAFKVQAVDTTAAGDTFIGALTSQLQPDFSNLAEAILFANRASSITVQSLGAQPSIPTLEQIQAAQ